VTWIVKFDRWLQRVGRSLWGKSCHCVGGSLGLAVIVDELEALVVDVLLGRTSNIFAAIRVPDALGAWKATVTFSPPSST
jgi:hypothetical protein